MTQEEIIKMATQAGFTLPEGETWYEAFPQCIEAFANLVAEKERNACFDFAIKAAEDLIDTATALEREACAKVVEDVEPSFNPVINITNQLAAAAIRARGEPTSRGEA